MLLPTLLSLALAGDAAAARDCPPVQSCSKQALSAGVDPCCVASPAGLFVFRQRFEPDVGGDMGSWGIDGLEVLAWVLFIPRYAPLSC